jgi:hypothetical protein
VIARRRCLNRSRGARRGDRRRESAIEQSIQIAHAQGAENEDLAPDAAARNAAPSSTSAHASMSAPASSSARATCPAPCRTRWP